LPLERQVKAMARQGLKTTSQSLFDQLWEVAKVLRPLGCVWASMFESRWCCLWMNPGGRCFLPSIQKGRNNKVAYLDHGQFARCVLFGTRESFVPRYEGPFARFYSVLETCKLLGIHPHRYLKHVVDTAFHGQPFLLPHEFKER
jgi:hypothetical protein